MENRYMGKRKKLIAAFILTGLGLAHLIPGIF